MLNYDHNCDTCREPSGPPWELHHRHDRHSQGRGYPIPSENGEGHDVYTGSLLLQDEAINFAHSALLVS